MVMRRAWWPVGVVCASVVVLSGCVGGGGPVVESVLPVVTEQSVEPSPSPSVSVEERLLAMIPEEAKGDTLMAAEAMAKFFVELQTELFQVGDSALVEFLSLPECEFCTSSVAAASELHVKGSVQVGGEVEFAVGPSQMVMAEAPGEAYVGFVFTESESRYVDAAGNVEREFPQTDIDVAIHLRLQDGLWRVAGVGFELA